MYSHWSVSGVIEDGKLLWQMDRAPAACLELYGALTESSLFVHDPPDEHAILTGDLSFMAYGGRATVSKFEEKAPLVHMLPSHPRIGVREARLVWHCTCGAAFSRLVTVNEDTFSIVRIICDEFDHHVGR